MIQNTTVVAIAPIIDRPRMIVLSVFLAGFFYLATALATLCLIRRPVLPDIQILATLAAFGSLALIGSLGASALPVGKGDRMPATEVSGLGHE